MTSCNGRTTTGFNFDFVKSSSTSTITTLPTSSPSSTTSETTNSPQSSLFFTKKPRTIRKRPNQTFNEAATILSTAYPNLFSTENLKKPEKFTKPVITEYNDSSEPLLLFRECDYLNDDAFSFLRETKRGFQTKPNKVLSVREKEPCELSNGVVRDGNCDEMEDFDCESILDEEIEEGIDSIMGSRVEGGSSCGDLFHGGERFSHGCVKALRRGDDANRWNIFVVDMLEISPRIVKNDDAPAKKVTKTTTEKKKKKKKEEKVASVSEGLLLKLNYDDVRNAWSDRGSPFADESPGNDVTARLSFSSKRKKLQGQVDLFVESGIREHSVLRSKKHTRNHFRKVNQDQRSRMKT